MDDSNLYVAICNGNVEVVRQWLESDDFSNIQLEVKSRNDRCLLLEYEGESDEDGAKQRGRTTPLFLSVCVGAVEIVNLILMSGKCDINGLTNGLSLLHAAVVKQENLILQKLLNVDGVNIEILSKGNRTTPLLFAALYNNWEAAEILLEHGADVNSTNCSGLLPIHISSINLDYDSLSVLLRYGADPNSLSKSGHQLLSPLMFALSTKKKIHHIVKLLLDSGANPSFNVPNYSGVTPVHTACERGDHVSLQLLIDRGGYSVINRAGHLSGVTPLHTVSRLKPTTEYRSDICAQILINAGSSLYRRCYGMTPLETALVNNSRTYSVLSVLVAAYIERSANEQLYLRLSEVLKSLLEEQTGRDDEFYEFYGAILSNIGWNQPRTLSQMCRLVVRKCLTKPIVLSSLKIPSSIKKYILFDPDSAYMLWK